MAHKGKMMRYPFSGEFEFERVLIDLKLVKLITSLWRRNIETSMCCQNRGEGNSWIQFANKVSFEAFMKTIDVFISTNHKRDDFQVIGEMSFNISSYSRKRSYLYNVHFELKDLPIMEDIFQRAGVSTYAAD